MNFSDTEWSLPQFLDMKYLWLSNVEKSTYNSSVLIIKQTLHSARETRSTIHTTCTYGFKMHQQVWIEHPPQIFTSAWNREKSLIQMTRLPVEKSAYYRSNRNILQNCYSITFLVQFSTLFTFSFKRFLEFRYGPFFIMLFFSTKFSGLILTLN